MITKQNAGLWEDAASSYAQSQPCNRRLWLALLLLVSCSVQVSTARAQYAVDWSAIAGGGGTSTGGVYSVSGTIGQPDAGTPMTNGQFSVTVGFWALPISVQTLGAPTLKIVPGAPGQATLSWNPDTPGFVLQETVTLSPANWLNSTSGPTNPVHVPATATRKFYRLFKP